MNTLVSKTHLSLMHSSLKLSSPFFGGLPSIFAHKRKFSHSKRRLFVYSFFNSRKQFLGSMTVACDPTEINFRLITESCIFQVACLSEQSVSCTQLFQVQSNSHKMFTNNERHDTCQINSTFITFTQLSGDSRSVLYTVSSDAKR